MLMPKRVKRRKQFRGTMAGKALRGNKSTTRSYKKREGKRKSTSGNKKNCR